MSLSQDEVIAYIEQAATARGIDPATAIGVARSEGGLGAYIQARGTRGGYREPAHGHFQLLVGGEGTGYPKGMGNLMIEQTGIDPRDPANWKPSIDFALNQASKDGWRQWYGAEKVGIGRWDGIGGNATTGPVAAGSSAPATGIAGLPSLEGVPAPAHDAAATTAAPMAGLMALAQMQQQKNTPPPAPPPPEMKRRVVQSPEEEKQLSAYSRRGGTRRRKAY